MCVTESTAVVLFLLSGKVIKPCGDFSLLLWQKSTKLQHAIYDIIFFFQLLFLQTELYHNLKGFNFLHPK